MPKIIRKSLIRLLVPLLPLINIAAVLLPLRTRRKEQLESSNPA